MLTSSLQGLLPNQSLETIFICNVELCFPHKNIACIHMCDECTRSNALNVCHVLLSISLPHEQVCSQTFKTSGLPIRVKFWHFRTICEQTVDNPFFFFLQLMIIRAWRRDFVQLLCYISPRISLHDLPCHRTRKISFLANFSCSPGRNPWFEYTSVIIHNILASLTFSLSATQINMVKEWCWFS